MMLSEVLKSENVQNFFKTISNRKKYNEKEIPTTFNNEVVATSYYTFLIGMDAIIKYMIIIDDPIYFDKYLKQIESLLKKVNSHNEIKIGITKLLINFCKIKLQLEDIESINNKERIINYIYQKYIVDGYVFHSFPSMFINDVKNNGLKGDNYNYQLEDLIDINKVFEKYKVKDTFSKKLEKSSYITVTDSPFMGCFYAYNSPKYLKELSTGLVDKDNKYEIDSFFMKNYKNSYKNVKRYIRKVDMFNSDSKKVLNFLDKQWDLYNINESYPVMCMIKRNILGLNYIKNIENIIESSKSEDIYTSVSKVLDVRYNDLAISNNISNNQLEIIYLPKIDEVGYNVDGNNIKKEQDNNKFIDDYGNTTILALAGLLLITIAILVSLIKIGR